MSYRYPPLATWQAFEVFCRDFFEIYWDAQAMTVVGRQGQSQDGVDVLAMLPGMRWRGIQCKQKADGQLTRSEMAAELAATSGLNVGLERYVFATTAPRDAESQAWARELAETVDFDVEVVAWHDVCDALADVRYRDVIAKHFPHTQLVTTVADPTDPAEALDAFRSQHLGAILRLPTLAHAPRQRNADLVLTDVYTALDVTAKVAVRSVPEGGESPSRLGGPPSQIGLPGEDPYIAALVQAARERLPNSKHPVVQAGETVSDDFFERRCRALEAAAANRHLVLVGAPGSGKSTFGRFLVACLLGERLGRKNVNLATLQGEVEGTFRPWPHGAPLAFFVSLQKFQASSYFPAEGVEGEAKHLLDFLVGLAPDRSLFRRGLHRELQGNDRVLIVLDGLDETQAAEKSRAQLKGILSGLVLTYRGCRVLVTSRPYAYQRESPWRLDDAGFESVELAPFSEWQQRAFVEAWYRRLEVRGLVDVGKERRKAMSEDLKSQIRRTEYLEPLAERPLMLTMMADIHAANSGRLPTGGRSALYRESIDLLLDRWNETREGTKPTEALGMSLEQIREALQKLAFEVHRSQGNRESETAEIGRAQLWEVLVDTRKAYDPGATADDEQILNYLHQRSGILVGESEKVYRFPHRSYQEYLAAKHLVDTDDDFPNQLDARVTDDPTLWREVVLLAAEQSAERKWMVWALVEMLVPESVPEGGVPLDDPRWFRALLAGLSIRETGLWRSVSPANQGKLERVRRWLRRIVELGALEVRDRALAGQVLGLLGDDRPGVGLGDGGLPSFDWVEIPGGPFLMGGKGSRRDGPQFEARVERFGISRYPVTQAQYQCFVDDGGYTESWISCWTEAGWEWRRSSVTRVLDSSPLDRSNYPKVNVNWFEAVAYCRWFSERTGIGVRLPTDAERERACRGIDGRDYPWGNTFDASLCNSLASGIGTVTPVGLFPEGEAPAGAGGQGILDACGNVLEWCSTKSNGDSLEDLEGEADRVLRGGSFLGNRHELLNTRRVVISPGVSLRIAGFRLVKSP